MQQHNPDHSEPKPHVQVSVNGKELSPVAAYGVVFILASVLAVGLIATLTFMEMGVVEAVEFLVDLFA